MLREVAVKVPVDIRGADQLEVMPPASLTRKIEAHLQIAGELAS